MSMPVTNANTRSQIAYERALTEHEIIRLEAVSKKLRSLMPKPSIHPRFKLNKYKIRFPTVSNVYTDYQLHKLMREKLSPQHRVIATYYFGSQPQEIIDPTIKPNDRDICDEIMTPDPYSCSVERENILTNFIIDILEQAVIIGTVRCSELTAEAALCIQKLIAEHKKHIIENKNPRIKSELQQLVIDEYFYQRALFKESEEKEGDKPAKKHTRVLGALLGLKDHDMRYSPLSLSGEIDTKSRPSNISIVDSLQVDIFNNTIRSIHHGQPYPLKEVCEAIFQRKFIIPQDIHLRCWIYPLARKSLYFEVFDKNIKAALKDMARTFPLDTSEDFNMLQFADKVRFPSNNPIGRRLYYLQFLTFIQHEDNEKNRIGYTKQLAAVWLNQLSQETAKDTDERLFVAFAKLVEKLPQEAKTFLDAMFGLFMAWVGEKKGDMSLELVQQNDKEYQWRFSFPEAHKVHHYVLEKNRTLSSSRRQFLRCMEDIALLDNQDELKILHETFQSIDDILLRRLITKTELQRCSAMARSQQLYELSDAFSMLSLGCQQTTFHPHEIEKLITILEKCHQDQSMRALDENVQWRSLCIEAMKLLCRTWEKQVTHSHLPLFITFCQSAQRLRLNFYSPQIFSKWHADIAPIFAKENREQETKQIHLLKCMAQALKETCSEKSAKSFKAYVQILFKINQNSISAEIQNRLEKLCDTDFCDRGKVVSEFMAIVFKIDLGLADHCLKMLHELSHTAENDVLILLQEYHDNRNEEAIVRLLSHYHHCTTVGEPALLVKKICTFHSLLTNNIYLEHAHHVAICRFIYNWLQIPPQHHSTTIDDMVADIISKMIKVASTSKQKQLSEEIGLIISILNERSGHFPLLIKQLSENNFEGIFDVLQNLRHQGLEATSKVLNALLSLKSDIGTYHLGQNFSLLGTILSSNDPQLYLKGATWLEALYKHSFIYNTDFRKQVAELSSRLAHLSDQQRNIIGQEKCSSSYQFLMQLLQRNEHLCDSWKQMMLLLSSSCSSSEYNIVLEQLSKLVRQSMLPEIVKEGFEALASKSILEMQNDIASHFLFLSSRVDRALANEFFEMLVTNKKGTWRDFFFICRINLKADDKAALEKISEYWKKSPKIAVTYSHIMEEAQGILFLVEKGHGDIGSYLHRMHHLWTYKHESMTAEIEPIVSQIVQEVLKANNFTLALEFFYSIADKIQDNSILTKIIIKLVEQFLQPQNQLLQEQTKKASELELKIIHDHPSTVSEQLASLCRHYLEGITQKSLTLILKQIFKAINTDCTPDQILFIEKFLVWVNGKNGFDNKQFVEAVEGLIGQYIKGWDSVILKENIIKRSSLFHHINVSDYSDPLMRKMLLALCHLIKHGLKDPACADNAFVMFIDISRKMLKKDTWCDHVDDVLSIWAKHLSQKLNVSSFTPTKDRNKAIDLLTSMGVIASIPPTAVSYKPLFSALSFEDDFSYMLQLKKLFPAMMMKNDAEDILQRVLKAGMNMLGDFMIGVHDRKDFFLSTIKEILSNEKLLKEHSHILDDGIFPVVSGCLFYPIFTNILKVKAAATLDSPEINESFAKTLKATALNNGISDELSEVFNALHIGFFKPLTHGVYERFSKDVQQLNASYLTTSDSNEYIKTTGLQLLDILSGHLHKFNDQQFSAYCFLHEIMGYHVIAEAAIPQHGITSVQWTRSYYHSLELVYDNCRKHGAHQRWKRFVNEVICLFRVRASRYETILFDYLQEFINANASCPLAYYTQLHHQRAAMKKKLLKSLAQAGDYYNLSLNNTVKAYSPITTLIPFLNVNKIQRVDDYCCSEMKSALMMGYCHLVLNDLCQASFDGNPPVPKEICDSVKKLSLVNRCFILENNNSYLNHLFLSYFESMFFGVTRKDDKLMVEKMKKTDIEKSLYNHCAKLALYPVFIKHIFAQSSINHSYYLAFKPRLIEEVLNILPHLNVNDMEFGDNLCFHTIADNFHKYAFEVSSGRNINSIFIEEHWQTSIKEAQFTLSFLRSHQAAFCKKTLDHLQILVENCRLSLTLKLTSDKKKM